ncbi:lazarillo protein-like [Cimex lectularius]|uniref:Lipocalin/cytosolic fatty-acid binding domain-containing protein n=1 Tax=Cimex lectularius TaxID=79782 RepID=A0A8I6TEM2_CIMLE|nr:lazarillo protein-like [Cimex lectularius]
MDFKGIVLVLTVFCLLSSVHAAKCSQKKPAAAIDWGLFKGEWYQYKSFGDGFHRTFSRCLKDVYVTKDDSSSYREHSYMTRLLPIHFSSKNLINVISTSTFTLKSNGWFSSDVTFTLLDADYSNYAVLWSCKDGLFKTSESSWILTKSREPQFSLDTQQKLEASLQKFGLSLAQYGDVSQSSCN